MENLICVTGPRGAGKETVLNAILSSSYGRLLRRVVPFTTRKKRITETDGKEYFFISMEEYSRIKDSDVLYSVHIGRNGNHYRSGTLKSEFDSHNNGIIDITVEGARILSHYAKRSLLLYVYASPEERCERIMKRQDMSKREALALMANEPSPGSMDTVNDLYPEFTILHNHDAARAQSLLGPVYEFLGASVLR